MTDFEGGRKLLFRILISAVLGMVWDAEASTAQRIRPPESLKCPRDHLTSFTGTVLSYSRSSARTEIRMRTDENTTERFVLHHPKSKDPSKFFLLRAVPFKQGDWSAIESATGRLLPNMRATVWVCDDGSNPIIDWQPPR